VLAPLRRHPVRAAVISGVVAVIAIAAVGLGNTKKHLAATNSRVIASGSGEPVAPGVLRCQGGEYVPTDARRLRFFTSPWSGSRGQPLEVTLTSSRGVRFADIHVPGGYPKGALYMNLPPIRQSEFMAQLCVRNLGRIGMGLAGNYTSNQPESPGAYNTPGEPTGNVLRADYFLAGTQSWFAMAPTIARRLPLYLPSWMGSWTMWVLLALALASAAFAVTLVARQAAQA